jgi:hypothetical protein
MSKDFIDTRVDECIIRSKIKCHFCQEEGEFLGNTIKDFTNFAVKNNWRKFVLSGDFKYACPKHIDQIDITQQMNIYFS